MERMVVIERFIAPSGPLSAGTRADLAEEDVRRIVAQQIGPICRGCGLTQLRITCAET